jgi:hypothetical protein
MIKKKMHVIIHKKILARYLSLTVFALNTSTTAQFHAPQFIDALHVN